MNIKSVLEIQRKYIKDNHFIKLCGMNLCCFEWNIYKNGIEYLQQFICFV